MDSSRLNHSAIIQSLTLPEALASSSHCPNSMSHIRIIEPHSKVIQNYCIGKEGKSGDEASIILLWGYSLTLHIKYHD